MKYLLQKQNIEFMNPTDLEAWNDSQKTRIWKYRGDDLYSGEFSIRQNEWKKFCHDGTYSLYKKSELLHTGTLGECKKMADELS